jgi:hypothetical protein
MAARAVAVRRARLPGVARSTRPVRRIMERRSVRTIDLRYMRIIARGIDVDPATGRVVRVESEASR